MQTVLITGGAGFIGSHLAERLLERGTRVVVLDNFDPFYDPAVKSRNIAVASSHPAYRLVRGDIRDAAALEAAFGEHHVSAVVHLAARAGVRPSILEPEVYTSVNLLGTTALLEACRRNRVDKFVFGSSSSVYGNNRKVPFAEDDPVDHPISPYAATKKAGEILCHAHHHLFGLAVSCLRFFTVYGPRQRPEMAIHAFTRAIAAGAPVQQFGADDSARDYTYVSDIVDGIERALERTVSYHVWNLGGSGTVRLSELIGKIAVAIGREAGVAHRPQQPGDVDRTWADGRLAERELGWSPKVGIDEGIARFVAWYREQPRAGAEETA